MAKILAKIQRRHNGNELPDRRELVEMDLFDTDRNPWPGKLGGGGLWIRHEFTPEVPFDPALNATPDTNTNAVLGAVDMVVERPSFAVCFLSAIFDVGPGGIDGSGDQHVNFTIRAESTATGNVVETTMVENIVAAGERFYTGNVAFGYAVLNPATYDVRIFAWKDTADMPATVEAFASVIALLPAGLAGMGMGWGGTGG